MLLAGLFALSGCSGKNPPAPTADKATPAPAAKTEDRQPAPADTKPVESPRGGELLSQAQTALAAGRFAEAQAAVDELRQLKNLSEEHRKQLAELESSLAAMADKENDADRDASLKKVPTFIANGQLDEAGTALDSASARKPTDEQREEITKLRQQIESIRGAQRKLGTWMKLIGSGKRSDFRAAQNALLDEPEAALPLLIAAVKEPGDKQRTINILETLRQLRRPKATLPAMVGVLQQKEQKECWPDVVETLSRISEDGAGPLLLKLWTSSEDAEQRALALTALSRVSDPPTETTMALLPRLFQDGADLPATLMCVSQAVRRHDQTDLVALHGFGANVSAEQTQQLAGLSARLEALRGNPDANISRSAKMLSVALGLVTPEPFANLQVVNTSGEYPESPGKAAIDGVWNSADLAKQWYHALGPDSSILLDLGEEKTVTGVVIWNFNQVNGSFRGWKHAEIFVSPTPTALNPVATGVVPMAPGANDAADYSTLISVPCVTGRYVKLKAKDLWNPNTYTGLAEIQVLGF